MKMELIPALMGRKPALAFCITLIASLGAKGAIPTVEVPVEAWAKRYSNVVSNSAAWAVKVVCDADGDIIVTGSTDEGKTDGSTGLDMLTIKYSGADGTVRWQRLYNGPANRDDLASAVAVDSSGNAVVTGSSDNGTNTDYYTAKYAAADGALLWEHRYNGPANSDDYPSAVAVDGSGNVVVTGGAVTVTNSDYYTAKYAAADGALLWEKRHAGYASALALDRAGNVVVTGSSMDDFYTVKYGAADGALRWEQRYNGPANDDDSPRAVAVDSNGDVVVTGSSQNGSNTDYYTAKYAAADGALLWEQRYNGPNNRADYPSAVAVDGSGNVVVTGCSHGGGFGCDYYTAKYAAADGSMLWEKRYNGPADHDDYAHAVAVDSAGNVMVTGESVGSGDNFDYYTAKHAAADGSLVWEQRYNGPANSADSVRGLAIDGKGDVVVAGFSPRSLSCDLNVCLAYDGYYTAKYAAVDGALLWEQRYKGPGNYDDQAQAIKVDSTGNVVVTGSSRNDTDTDYYTAKYAAADGALLWEQRYNGPGDDNAVAVAVESNGNVVVTGSSHNGTNTDYYTIKYAAADGALMWKQRYNGPANRDDYGRAVAVDSNGDVVVTGSSRNDANTDYYTAKYRAVDGALLWEQRYNGPANGDDNAAAVAVDSNDDVIVTGTSHGANTVYYTAKYRAVDGALLWDQPYYHGISDDEAAAVAVDSNGNVVVTGRSSHECFFCPLTYDYYTAKYAASDGTLLWERSYNGTAANGDDYAKAVAVDSSGNVVVTGTSHNGPNTDYYTAKYAAADGSLLWEQRYNGPANGDDYATAVATDSSGNVVVTGNSTRAYYFADVGSVFEYYTAKYAASDGTLLWEKSYNAPAGGNNFLSGSHSLALGPDGMVAVTGSSDGRFGVGISYDYMTVKYMMTQVTYPTLVVLSLALAPEGARLRFTGDAGRTYRLQRASDPTGPWTTFAALTAPPNGTVEHLDPTPSSGPAFYRVAAP